MKGFYLAIAVVVAAVASANGASIQNEHDVKWYDCTGKAAGDYMHPWDCNRYMACSEGGIASEMDCATCNVDPVRCPDGMLVWDDVQKRCEWADVTECKVAGNGTTTEGPTPSSSSEGSVTMTTEDSATDQPIVEPPKEGGPCDPELCENWGYCQDFLRCDKTTKVWIKEKCGKDLVWNPLDTSGSPHVHGGNCDLWGNLTPEVERQYRTDPNCLACFWEALGECQQEYLYQAPKLTDRTVQRLSCAKGLVFSQAKETCQWCQDVVRGDGTTCC